MRLTLILTHLCAQKPCFRFTSERFGENAKTQREELRLTSPTLLQTPTSPRLTSSASASSVSSSANAPAEQRIVVVGGTPLTGNIPIGGSKNASLALLAGSLLASDGVTVLQNLPRISDIAIMAAILRELGVVVTFSDENRTATLDASHLKTFEAPPDLVARMRGSFFVLGPLLARLDKSRVAQPGGCNIGARAIDLHIKGLEALGATVDVSHGSVTAESGPNGLVGASVYLDKPSVGATMNTMMAASLAHGTTVIENAAQEPDVEDLGNLINCMGGKVSGHGSGTVTIEGVETLHGCNYRVMPDRIEAGTFAVAIGISGGDAVLEGANAAHLRPVLMKLAEVGIVSEEVENGLRICAPQNGDGLKATKLVASPHPGFPTDLQQPFTALLTLAQGTSMVTDTVYEGRNRYLSELAKMGAQVVGEGRTSIVTGVSGLTGADVEATDLRAGAALVVAALKADGQTRVFKTEHLDRGYEQLVEKLQKAGATIWREDEFGRRTDTPLPSEPVSTVAYSNGNGA